MSSAAAERPRPSEHGPVLPGWICIGGFMGVGKSRVGRILARRLEYPFVDTDQEIEQIATMSVKTIFATRGEAVFRRYEQTVVGRVVRLERAVVAVGGGTIVDPENRRRIRERGPLIILEASVETILARTRRWRRPLLQGEDPKARIATLLAERAAVYAQGDLHVSTDGQTPAVVAEAILRALHGRR